MPLFSSFEVQGFIPLGNPGQIAVVDETGNGVDWVDPKFVRAIEAVLLAGEISVSVSLNAGEAVLYPAPQREDEVCNFVGVGESDPDTLYFETAPVADLALLVWVGNSSEITGYSAAELKTAVLTERFDDVVIARDPDETVSSFTFKWGDGTNGVYTRTEKDASGATNAFTVTYLGSPTRTVTQPTITRDAAGAAITRPALTVT